MHRFSKTAALPKRSSDGAAGYDLYSAERVEIAAHARAVVDTAIGIALPPHPDPSQIYAARIVPRSGLATRGKTIDAGLIDADYRGRIGVVLVNHSDQPFAVDVGDRIAQLIIISCHVPELLEVNELPGTARGAAGFGSTGV